MKTILYFLIPLLLIACKNDQKNQVVDSANGKILPLKYAKGFTVEDFGTYKILEIKNPWPKAEKSYRYVLLNTDYDVDFWDTQKNQFDGIFEIPIKKIVVTSTTHIPALELLNVEETLIGFPGVDYISS